LWSTFKARTVELRNPWRNAAAALEAGEDRMINFFRSLYTNRTVRARETIAAQPKTP
jgi:hypothetical protein